MWASVSPAGQYEGAGLTGPLLDPLRVEDGEGKGRNKGNPGILRVLQLTQAISQEVLGPRAEARHV